MQGWMRFVAALSVVLWDLYEYVTRHGDSDPELEKQLAMRIIREAKDAKARAEFT